MPLSAVIAKSSNSMDAIDRMGEWFAKSGMFGADRAEQGKIMALTCMTEGLTPMEFSRTYDIVFGKLRKKSMAAFAEFRKRGGRVKWIETGEDGKLCSAEFTFEGQTVTMAYTMDQARQAGLVKKDSGYDKNPGNMLRARVISNALGMLAPEIFAGEYDDDAPQAPQMNLAPEAPATPAEPKPAKVTSVETVVVDPPREKAAAATEKTAGVDFRKALQSKSESQGEAAPAKAPSAPTAPATPRTPPPATATPMSTETATELLKVLRTPDEIMKGVAFFIAQKWLAEGQTIDDLSEAAARKVIGNADSFRKKVLGVA